MVVDIGGGTTEVAIISLGGIVTSQSIRVAGDEMDDSIISYIRKTYNLMIGDRTAEAIKMEIGSAETGEENASMEIRGRDLLTGLPKTIEITGTEIANALRDTVLSIVDAVKSTLEKTPPELAADIMDRGIVLTGRRPLCAISTKSSVTKRKCLFLSLKIRWIVLRSALEKHWNTSIFSKEKQDNQELNRRGVSRCRTNG